MRTICPKCKDADRPYFHCDLCNGFGYTETMEAYTLIQIKLPEKFNIALERRIIDLKEIGVKKTKAQLVCELAQIGLLNSKIE